jgi:hypothetical protein
MLFSIVAFVSLACAGAESSDATIAALLQQADRVIIGIPEDVTEVAAGDSFQVDIRRALRGSGQKGTLATISNTGKEKSSLRFEKGKQYVFLLKKNAGGKGWVKLGSGVFSFADGKIRHVADGKTLGEWTLEGFLAVAEKNFPEEDPVPARTGPVGKWAVGLSQQGNDFIIWLVDIAQQGDKYEARLLGTSRAGGSASTLKSSEISGDELHLVFDLDGSPFDFRGRLTEGSIRGNIAVGDAMVIPAFMQPTDATNTRGFDVPGESKGRNDFVKAAGESNTFKAMGEFVARHETSPLALEAYRSMIGEAEDAGLNATQFSKLADDYLRTARGWGDRVELRAYVDLGVALAGAGYLPELAAKYLDAAESRFTDASPGNWKLGVRTERARLLIGKGERDAAIKLLEQLYAAHPFQAEVTWMLARETEQAKQTDRAIVLYGELAALPMMERMLSQALQGDKKVSRDEFPSRALRKLWQEKHGNTDKLSEYLDELFEKRLHALATEQVAPRKAEDGTRVVLCELFTGSECPPCVGADAATTALEATYAKSELIVLRYHQHIPAPDPLANDDTQERFESYQGQGTPSLFINGRQFAAAGGFMPEVPRAYQMLRSLIDPYLREKIDLKIDLSARAADGKISLKAVAGGLKNFPDHVRLRLVLTEDKIPFVAGNGIRTHEMIVRSMPGGVKGIEPEEGKLAYAEEVDLAKLKAGLLRQLKRVEGETTAPFPVKPLDFKALHLVGFLQDQRTGEVLQAAAIPVSGNLAIPAAAAEGAARKR